MLNMFRMLIHPSSGVCDLFVELFHGLYCSGSMWYQVGLSLLNYQDDARSNKHKINISRFVHYLAVQKLLYVE